MRNNRSNLISLDEVAHRTGASISALNYYVNLGLLRVADRQGNKRLFSQEEVMTRYRKIQELRREGYPLRIIVSHLQGGGLR
jgi:DNA-binding transcriptional MerR regulator